MAIVQHKQRKIPHRHSATMSTTGLVMTREEAVAIGNIQADNAHAFATNRVMHTIEIHPSKPYVVGGEVDVTTEAKPWQAVAYEPLKSLVVVKLSYRASSTNRPITPIVIDAHETNVRIITALPTMEARSDTVATEDGRSASDEPDVE
ncbi:hypothetical protein LTR15_003214 [Elasticomyces elasticus]|nr:hypothetical protein LTR15_003214 [Elasticomyces elasticus]